MQFLYMVTAGSADPTRASVPFHLAVNGSIEAGHSASIALLGDAAELIAGDTIETLEGIGLPPMRDLVRKARDHEIPVYV